MSQVLIDAEFVAPAEKGAAVVVPIRRASNRIVAVVLSVGAVILLALTFRPVIEGDGVGYYSYLHAVYVSHSLSFENEYAAAIASHTPVYVPSVTTRSASGRLTDFFPVGPAVLSSPAYLIALAFQPSGEPQYGAPFVQAFTFASLFYGLAGLAICYLLASVVLNRRSALLGVLVAVFATPYVFYLLSDPSYSHTFSVFCVSTFLYVWWKGPPATYRGWLLLGVLGGLMAMTRFQDGLLMAVLLVDVKKVRRPALMLVPGMLIGFAPQLVVDYAQFGTVLPQRPPGQALDPLAGQYLGVLFSSSQGLLTWTPAALFAAIGIFLLRDRRLKIAGLIGLVVELLVIGSAPDSVGYAFGQRRFLDLLPFAVIGFAALADRFEPWIRWVAAGVLIVWNLTLMAGYEYLFPTGDPGFAHLTVGQLAAVPYLPRLLAKGAVVRDLVLWSQAHTTFQPLPALSMLLLEAVCVAAAAAAAWLLSRRAYSRTETEPASP